MILRGEVSQARGQTEHDEEHDEGEGHEQDAEALNRAGNKPPESETGTGSQGIGAEKWGDLPPYLNSPRNRGSRPKVPPKFRNYWEAWLKNKRKAKR